MAPPPLLGTPTRVVQAAMSVTKSSFIVFFINLVNLKAACSPAENAIAYINFGCSILAGEYESVHGYRTFVKVSSCE